MSDEIKKMLFDKSAKVDVGSYLLDLYSILEKLERHVEVIKVDNKTNIVNIENLQARELEVSRIVKTLSLSHENLQKNHRKNFKLSLVALVMILIICWQSTPVLVEKLINFALKVI